MLDSNKHIFQLLLVVTSNPIQHSGRRVGGRGQLDSSKGKVPVVAAELRVSSIHSFKLQKDRHKKDQENEYVHVLAPEVGRKSVVAADQPYLHHTNSIRFIYAVPI